MGPVYYVAAVTAWREWMGKQGQACSNKPSTSLASYVPFYLFPSVSSQPQGPPPLAPWHIGTYNTVLTLLAQ